MRERKVDLKLPKFTATSSSSNVMDQVMNLGLEEPFEKLADSIMLGMSEDRSMFIDGLFHKVRWLCLWGSTPLVLALAAVYTDFIETADGNICNI